MGDDLEPDDRPDDHRSASMKGPPTKPDVSASRLFSKVNPHTLRHEPGSVFGAACLVAGTTVGAGILALPVAAEATGFLPSSAGLIAGALWSIASGLTLAEVNINTMCELGQGGVSINSMARRTLGGTGANLAAASYLLLHYAVLVAYIAKGGEVLSSVSGLPGLPAAGLFVGGLGLTCYFSSPKVMNTINSVLVGLIIASFLGLLGAASGNVQPAALLKADWHVLPAIFPVVSLAFVYQNVVPVVATSLEGDITKVRTAVVGGIFVPLLMFILWDWAILGSLGGSASSGGDPLAVLAAADPLVGPLIAAFSLLAVATSFIGFVLGLTDFVADTLQLPTGSQALPYAITLGPPLLLALSFPDVFFGALDIAGTYGVLVLFGLVPAAMAWSERYGNSTLACARIVPGGKAGLLLVGGVASGVIANELFDSISRFLPQ
ncbi:hypothetical protein WJX72_010819 [[Myrmecia] bisecta]|uniref:Tyrosine-specific transport protein n=1 Tax=[Myrmecia] bisecta TaxID=41462 RepID=A0AAW1PPR8_9CHLO